MANSPTTRNERFLAAASLGDAASVAAFLSEGADPKYKKGLALERASAQGHAECVALLAPLCDPMSSNSQRSLMAAVRGGHVECVNVLLPIADSKSRESLALRLAASAGFSGCVRLLLPLSDPLAANSEALLMACKGGHAECARLLASAPWPWKAMSSALGHAAREGHAECVKIILSISFSWESASDALSLAAGNGRFECAQLLLAAQASIRPDRVDVSALREAIASGREECAALIASHPKISPYANHALLHALDSSRGSVGELRARSMIARLLDIPAFAAGCDLDAALRAVKQPWRGIGSISEILMAAIEKASLGAQVALPTTAGKAPSFRL